MTTVPIVPRTATAHAADYVAPLQTPDGAAPQSDRSSIEPIEAPSFAYSVRGGQMARITFRGALLTLLTLGMHRFWLITRQRRTYWSGIAVDGEPMEYSGKPLELLLGFFVAVVVLAVILGGMNLALVFGGILAGFDLQLAFNFSLPLLVPLGYYAQYRARRYLAARTRWRGLRFGMAPGAARYMLVATGHLLLTLLTLGLLYPLMHQRLARFQQERTFYGTLRFRQDARWRDMLWTWLPAWFVLIAPMAVAAVSVPDLVAGLTKASAMGGAMSPEENEALGRAVIWTLGPLIAAFFLSWPLRRRYAAAAERVLMGGLSLGDARLESTLRTSKLLWIDVKGWFLTLGGLLILALIAVGIFFLALFAALFFGFAFGDAAISREAAGEFGEAIGGAIGAFLGALIYLPLFVVFSVTSQIASVHWPLRARIEALPAIRLEALSEARQRDADDAVEAGGFADALDVGAGF